MADKRFPIDISSKTTPVAADIVMIADSADSNQVKNLTIANLETMINDGYAQTANVLELDNSTSYTPSADYHPATKVYVDLVDASLTNHENDASNPHSVTQSQVGLSNVDNTSDANKPVSTAQQAALDLKANITYVDSISADIGTDVISLSASIDLHTADVSNPHSVTQTQVGLSNVDNTSDVNKPVSTAQQSALDLKMNLSTLQAPSLTAAPSGVPGSIYWDETVEMLYCYTNATSAWMPLF